MTTRIDTTVSEHWARLNSILVGQYGDMSIAEDALQEALIVASEQWCDSRGQIIESKAPANIPAWLLQVARRKAIDVLRRRSNYLRKLAELKTDEEISDYAASTSDQNEHILDALPDERLKLLFICCHPSINDDMQVALALRAVAGLSTDQIAAAYLTPTATMAQRMVRTQRTIAAQGIQYELPATDQLAERVDGVLKTLYLMFNKGYLTQVPAAVAIRKAAISLCDLLNQLLPNDPEIMGVYALMLFHDAREPAHTVAGVLRTLEEQDRTVWNRAQAAHANDILTKALGFHHVGPYQLQAAISGLHTLAPSYEQTDWMQIVLLYDQLLQIQPSPVVALNRAVALSFAHSPTAGLKAIEELPTFATSKTAIKNLQHIENTYLPLHVARTNMFYRLGDTNQASSALAIALKLCESDQESAYLKRKYRALFN